ncbi:membrane protein [Paenibacillus sp. E194]|uniref:PH domain-containing protein n=1 Tax=Paenibacillus sp. E194 TaxID=1458845 RepID=UPI0005C9296B|nr:PH domain-containing protein [Paenibacillus sp. E194]KJB85541.1 membrane protein [Paenibacillus sp. E194]
MENKLGQKLHPDYRKASHIAGVIAHGIMAAVIIAYVIIASVQGWIQYPAWIASGLWALSFIWFVWIEPVLTYRYFAFEVFEEELHIQSGVIYLKHTIVPMNRVQHVETERGPLLRKYGLSQLSVVTAATTHRILAVQEEEAQRLKAKIVELAKVDDHEE